MRGTRLYSYWRCKETEENLEIMRKVHDLLRNRIKLQRYEDLALNPLKALTGLYEFAGLSELESVKTWLNETTRKPEAIVMKWMESKPRVPKMMHGLRRIAGDETFTLEI